MEVLKAMIEDALAHVAKAEDAMQGAAMFSSDWSARVQLEMEFEHVRDAIRKFATLQLGIKQ